MREESRGRGSTHTRSWHVQEAPYSLTGDSEPHTFNQGRVIFQTRDQQHTQRGDCEMRFDLTGWAQQGTSCGQAELRNPGAEICRKASYPLSHTPEAQAVLTGAQRPPGPSNLQELKWGTNGREAWECARLSVLESVLCSPHCLSHILIKPSIENSETGCHGDWKPGSFEMGVRNSMLSFPLFLGGGRGN